MDQDIPFERIGGYRILRRLATGGTSDVLLARAEGPHGFERTVVLKLLLQQFRRDAPMEKMFAREAAAYARLSHPAIVKLYDFFSAEGQLVMVLEYIDGLPLNRFRAMLRKNGEQVDDRASIFIASRVFAALAAAHGARDPESGEFAPVIHRDVNPSNILIPWDGHVKLADFGIAKVAGVSSDTQAGFIKGTYGYMAPEQVRGEPITVRTDIYAAALLLWELLARRKAIQRGALPELEVLRAMAEPSLPSLDVLRPDLPQRLRDAISRGLEPSPDARSVTAEEMLIVLRESVTSNEGRNVLAETLMRVRPDVEGSRSGAPPAISADETAKVPSQPGAGRPPSVRPPSPSVDVAQPRAVATGHVASVTMSGTMVLGRLSLPPAAARAAASPKKPVATMAMGLLREASMGAYSAVASDGKAVSEERTGNAPPAPPRPMVPPPAPPPAAVPPRIPGAAGPRPPPVALVSPPLIPITPMAVVAVAPSAPKGASSPAMDSIPPVLGATLVGGNGAPPPAKADPPIVGQRVIDADSIPPVFAGSPVAQPIPPPPPAMLAVVERFESVPPTAPTPFVMPSAPPPAPVLAPPLPPPPPPAASPPPALFAPPAPATSPSTAPIAAMLASTLPLTRPSSSRPLPMSSPPIFTPQRVLTPLPPVAGLEKGTGGAKYAILAILAVVGSVVLVLALVLARKPEGSAATAVATGRAVTAQAAPKVTEAPAPTPAPIPTQAHSATPTATAIATPTPATPIAAPTPATAPAASTTATATSPQSANPLPLSSTDGEIVTPASAGGHRVFVDGRYAGDSPGPMRVHCGSHSVKVGSNGVPHTVTVPCGGEVSVSPR